MTRFPLVVCALLAPSLHAAPVVVVDGRVVIDGAGANTVADVHVEVTGNAGVLVTADVPAVVLVDGFLSVDLDLAEAVDAALAGETLLVSVTVDDGVAPLTATSVVGPVFFAAHASEAGHALDAASADAVGGLTDAELVSAAALAASGGPAVAWENLTSLPAGIADGDDGNVLSIGAGLTRTGVTLSVSALTGASIVDGTIGTNQIADDTLTSSHLASLGGADFAADSLAGADFAQTSFTSTDVVRPVVMRVEAQGCALRGRLTTATTCPQVTCNNGTGGLSCTTGLCGTLVGTCTNPLAGGSLLFGP